MPNRVRRSLVSSHIATVFAVLSIALGATERLAHSAASFYEGKTIRIIVGTSPLWSYVLKKF